MKNLTGSVEEFSLTVCEDLRFDIQQAACYGYKTGFSCATQILIGAFTECTATGEFDVLKFAKMIKPFLEDMGQHAIV
jgi:hypothetical protein